MKNNRDFQFGDSVRLPDFAHKGTVLESVPGTDTVVVCFPGAGVDWIGPKKNLILISDL